VRGPPRKCLGMSRRVTNKGESGFGIANGRGTVAVEWKHHGCDRLRRPRVLSMDQCYLHVKTVFLGGGIQRSLLVLPSTLIQRRDSCPPLPRVELIQKVSTKHQSVELIQKVSTKQLTNSNNKHYMYIFELFLNNLFLKSHRTAQIAAVVRGEGGGGVFNHYKNDLKRHAHTPSGVAGADL